MFCGLHPYRNSEIDMREIKLWLGRHPNVVITIIVALTVALVAAMYFGYDLAWIPALFTRAIWGGQ